MDTRTNRSGDARRDDRRVPARRFSVTLGAACPYLPGKVERKIHTPLSPTDMDHGRLVQAGFRRSHLMAYVPICPDCAACVPIRVPTHRFTWRSSFRRVMRRYRNMTVEVVPTRPSPEQYTLFHRYLRCRHNDGGMADMDYDDYRMMIRESLQSSALLEVRSPSPGGGSDLRAMCLFDRTEDGVSAVYSFFDPDRDWQGLGTFVILSLIRMCQIENSEFVYLGYWIVGSPKMAYKRRFHPLEGLQDGEWLPIQSDADGVVAR